MGLIKSKYWVLFLLFLVGKTTLAQNGIHLDEEHTFLIPMLKNDVIKGHAYVYLLDKISKDSNSFVIQVYDEYLHEVGEKKIVIDSKYKFDAAVYNGSNFVTKFLHEKDKIRYIVFDTSATITFDTVLNIKFRKAESSINEKTYKQTPLYAVNNQQVLDYINTESGKADGNTIIAISNDNKVWRYDQLSSVSSNLQFLAADNKYVVNSIYTYQKRNRHNDVNTNIEILSAQGVRIGNVSLFKNDSTSIYPISAEIQRDGIEVISQFTKRAHEFSKVKYGTCIHKISFNGIVLSEHFNEFTQTMIKDSLMKKYKLMVHSYLYLHKAVKLKNGNWLVAAEQLMRTQLRFRPFTTPPIIYNKKNICLMEIDDRADIVKMHVEPNKPDGIRLPSKYYRRPHNGAIVANAKDKMDISYFVRNDDDRTESISFIFTDWNYKSRKLSLGNMLYKDGEIKVDRFIVPTFTSYTKVGIYPARFGHVLMIKYDPLLGMFDFDNIKFNN